MTGEGTGRRSPALTTGALLVALVLLTALAIFLGARFVGFEDGPSRLSGDRDSWVSETERGEALQVAEQFALRMDEISGADPKGYAAKVKELLTTKGKAAFEKEYAALQQVGMDKNSRGSGKVLASGIADIDADSATALVVHDAVVITPQGTTGRHYRWSVDLERVGGTWLVDSFVQVA